MTLLEKVLGNLLEIQFNFEELCIYMEKSNLQLSEIERLLNDFRHIRENIAGLDTPQIKERLLMLDEREKKLLNERRILKQEISCYSKMKLELSDIRNKVLKIQGVLEVAANDTPLYNVRTTEGNEWFNHFINDGAEFNCKLAVKTGRTFQPSIIEQTLSQQPDENSKVKQRALKLQRNKKRGKWELVDVNTKQLVRSHEKLQTLLMQLSNLGKLIVYPSELKHQVQNFI